MHHQRITNDENEEREREKDEKMGKCVPTACPM
jgi:hypothetical protein